MSDIKQLYEKRLARYQTAIALEPVDRVPLAPGSNYFAEIYGGTTKQDVLYDMEKWLKSEFKFCEDFPEFDVLRNSRIYGPLYDAIGNVNYKLSGRDLPPNTQFQFVEKEYMLADEYDEFIANPTRFLITKAGPRILSELIPGNDPVRMHTAMFKAAAAQGAYGAHSRRRAQELGDRYGMPQPMGGFCLSPLDALSDSLRDLKGVMRDMRRQPDKVIAACEALVPEMANLALNTADPLKRWPIFIPTHKAMFLSPQEYDKFYWPSFKKLLEILVGSGNKVRVYLEGNQNAHIHHFQELPRASLLCDIDNGVDIVKAKELINGHQCLAGGLQDSLLILATPEQVREQVKLLCETIGREPGYVISGGCNIPYDTKPENLRAVCDAVEEFGWLDKSRKLTLKTPGEGTRPAPLRVTDWSVKKAEIGEILGEEEIIKNHWNQLESMAYSFWWQWVL
jgi:uroporphyrinogen-III decarboxylase